MTARAILELAYLSSLVPAHLYGKTQHKTLQARLSEDILVRHERSCFFRTAPGFFFLREFIRDTTLPDEYRAPIVARRRSRELQREPALAFHRNDLDVSHASALIDREYISNLIQQRRYVYVDPRTSTDDYLLVWSFATVARGSSVLSYRLGRYREGRDGFYNKRSIGFYTLITEHDRTLFDPLDIGLASSGIKAAKIDLDIMFTDPDQIDEESFSHIRFVIRHSTDLGSPCLITVVRFVCPDWFEPLRRRLAINHLEWLDLSTPSVNYFDDFEPWSQSVLNERRRLLYG